MYIDSHCHLNHKRLAQLGGVDQVVRNAAAAGVEGMLTVCCDIAHDFPEALALARQYGNVWCSIGTHPHDAGKEEEKTVTRERLVALAQSDPKIVAIGESGLDYFYKNSSIDDQKESFIKHIRACLETKLPLIVHARDADDDMIEILRAEGAGTDLKGVMHCFSSSRALGEAALDLGFYISFSGILTFKNAGDLQAFAKDVPLDRALIETDAPFLAPEPHRGKINEPALVTETAKCLAALHNVSEETVATITKENFFQLFDRGSLS